MSNETQLYFALGYCLFMLILMTILTKNTPKNVNSIYGYRTPKSMQNQDTWSVANTYANSLILKISYWSFLFPVLCYFLIPEQNIFFTIMGNCALIVLVIILTERHLARIFDQNGNRK